MISNVAGRNWKLSVNHQHLLWHVCLETPYNTHTQPFCGHYTC